jgi:hypothetical protein
MDSPNPQHCYRTLVEIASRRPTLPDRRVRAALRDDLELVSQELPLAECTPSRKLFLKRQAVRNIVLLVRSCSGRPGTKSWVSDRIFRIITAVGRQTALISGRVPHGGRSDSRPSILRKPTITEAGSMSRKARTLITAGSAAAMTDQQKNGRGPRMRRSSAETRFDNQSACGLRFDRRLIDRTPRVVDLEPELSRKAACGEEPAARGTPPINHF